MAGYILLNVVSTCRQYRELKQTQSTLQARNGLNTTTQKQGLLNFGKRAGSNGAPEETLTMEGLKFKSLFFAALFLVCFLRTLCLLFMTFKFSKLNQDTENDAPLNVVIRLFLDLPTLILISVFSAFSYYLSRLNMEIEMILH